MSCRDEGLCYGGLWLMFTTCEPLRPKVEAMKEFAHVLDQFKPRWRLVELGPCGLNCHKPM